MTGWPMKLLGLLVVLIGGYYALGWLHGNAARKACEEWAGARLVSPRFADSDVTKWSDGSYRVVGMVAAKAEGTGTWTGIYRCEVLNLGSGRWNRISLEIDD